MTLDTVMALREAFRRSSSTHAFVKCKRRIKMENKKILNKIFKSEYSLINNYKIMKKKIDNILEILI